MENKMYSKQEAIRLLLKVGRFYNSSIEIDQYEKVDGQYWTGEELHRVLLDALSENEHGKPD